jgi:signal transduction histidine kinase
VRRALGGHGSLRRRYAAVAAVFALLVLAIILLFGQLMSRSLSERYLEDLLSSRSDEAQMIADSLGDGAGEELQVVEKRRVELYRTLEGLAKKRILESIEVVNSDGEVVLVSDITSTERIPEDIVTRLEMDSLGDQEIRETERSYEIVAPLGGVGEVVFSVSKARIEERVGRLRRDLLRQTALVAATTLVTLVVAFVLVWVLIQRNRRLEEERREAEELATLGTLAANLAHEIRNPLNSINLNLELLEEDLAAFEAETSLATTRQEVGRLARLVSDFLTYARPSEPSFDPVRVTELLPEVVRFLKGEAQRLGAHLRFDPDLPELTVRADEGQLRQVLLNLMLNAIQAVAKLEASRRVVEVSARESGSEVQLVVRDRGDGIPEQDIDQARKAFFTRRRGGTGLGLAIADRIVEAHGGRLELHNLEPSGFEAVVVLPVLERGVKIGEPSAAGGSGRLAAIAGSG